MEEQKNVKEEMKQSSDCPHCDEFRERNSNFCGRCGKQLKTNPVIIYYPPSEK